jgi:low affinity Fe/Cu permease
MREKFRLFANATSEAVGTPWVFLAALLIVLGWGLSGPIFGFSDTWQLVINTGTTIVTFLMVFLVQNTQNRDARAIHLKLDELLRAMQGARTGLVNLEALSDDELGRLHKQFEQMQESASVRKDVAEEVKEDLEGKVHHQVHEEVTRHVRGNGTSRRKPK